MTKRLFFSGLLAAACFLFLALGSGIWVGYRPQPPARPSLDLAQIDPEVGEVITKARAEVLHEPGSSLAWGRLGMILWAHDYGVEANFCLAQAERLDPKEPRWPYVQGLGLLHPDPGASLAYLRRAAERSGEEDSLAFRLRLAEALLNTGQLEEAEQQLQTALRLDANHLRTRLDLGRLSALREDWPAAVESLSACVTDAHARRAALRLRAQAYRRLGQRQLAEADEDRAGKLPEDERWPDPVEAEGARLQRGLTVRLIDADNLRRVGKLDQAIAL